jgi:hypothetical protein
MAKEQGTEREFSHLEILSGGPGASGHAMNGSGSAGPGGAANSGGCCAMEPERLRLSSGGRRIREVRLHLHVYEVVVRLQSLFAVLFSALCRKIFNLPLRQHSLLGPSLSRGDHSLHFGLLLDLTGISGATAGGSIGRNSRPQQLHRGAAV